MSQSRTKTNVPSLVRRQLRWWGALFFVLLALSLLSMLHLIFYPFPDVPLQSVHLTRISWIGMIAPLIFLFIIYHSMLTRLIVHARRHGYAVCEHCGHPLGGLGERDTCTECAQACDVERARARWRHVRSRSITMNLIYGSIKRETGGTLPPDSSGDRTNPFGSKESVPHLVRRRLLSWRLLFIPLVLLFGVAHFFLMPYSVGPNAITWWGMRPTSIVMIAMYIFLPLSFVFHYVMVIRPVVHARRHGYAACEHCGYTLEGLGERGTCPECSEAFDVERAKVRWRHFRSRSATMKLIYGEIEREAE